MRFLMFEHGNGRRLGVLDAARSGTAVDLAELAKATGMTPPPADLMALIEAGDAGMALVEHLMAKLEPSAGAPVRWPLDEIGRNSERPCVSPRTMACRIGTQSS